MSVIVGAGVLTSSCEAEKKAAAPPQIYVPKSLAYEPKLRRSGFYAPETSVNTMHGGVAMLVDSLEGRLRRSRLESLNHDPTLSDLATELSNYLRETGQVPPYKFVRFAALRYGVGDIDIRVRTQLNPDGFELNRSADFIVTDLGKLNNLEYPTHVGIGLAEDPKKGAFVTIVYVRRLAYLRPVQKDLPMGGRVALVGRFYKAGVNGNATFVLAQGKGFVVPMQVQPNGLFEVTADLPNTVDRVDVSLSVVENETERAHFSFPIWVRGSEIETFAREPSQPTGNLTPVESARLIAAKINDDREAVGLERLELNEVAFGLAPEWAAQKQLTPQQILDALQRGGAPAFVVRPALLRGTSSLAAYESASQQASFRALVLDPALNQIAVGVAREGTPGGKESVALALMAGPSSEPVASQAQKLLARINGYRSRAGVTELTYRDDLAGAAQEAAQRLARDFSARQATDDEVRKTVFAMPNAPHQWKTGVFSVYSFNVNPPAEVMKALADAEHGAVAFGVVAVTEASHPQRGNLVYYIAASGQ